MFGSIVKHLYERFHETSEFQTNISVIIDDNASDKLGTIMVDLFYSKSYVPVGSFSLHTSIVENAEKQVRLCYLDAVELDRNMLIQDMVTIMTKIQTATTGILKRPEDVLFKFEMDLTKAGGYLSGFGITDVVYNDTMECYARRVDGPLFRVEVRTADHAQRTYDLDVKSINSTAINVSNTFSGTFIRDMITVAKGGKLTSNDTAAIEELTKQYTTASNEIDSSIVKILASYYVKNIGRWYGTVGSV